MKKRILAVILCVLMLLSVMPSSFSLALMLGDLDGDGYIKAADARLALRASVGLEVLTPEQEKAADADFDNAIKAADARLILRASVGLEELHIHSYTGQITKAPTCTEDGIKTFTCECGESYTEPVAKTGHTAVTDPAVAPTCTEKGKTEGSHCSACNTVLTPQQELAAKGHAYTSAVTAPTCTKKGYTTYTCSVCSHSYKDNEVKEKGHNYTSAVTAPTCTEKGYTTYTCSVCSHSYKDNEKAAAGHKHTSTVTKPATCSATGIRTYTCSCGNKYTETIAKNNNHVNTKEVAKVNATCISVGYEAGVYCNDCKKYTSGHEEIKKDSNNHINKKDVARVEATCISVGYEAGVYCNDCKKYTSGHEEIAKNNNHVNTKAAAAVEATCTTVGYTEGTYCNDCEAYINGHEEIGIDANAHKWNDGRIITAATCSETGTKLLTCTLDSSHTKSVTIPIDANAHKYAYETTLPTCTEDGYTTKYCEYCEAKESINPTQATGHLVSSLDKTTVKVANCEAEGYSGDEKCNACGEITKKGEIIPSFGKTHNFVRITVAPSCTAGGYTVKECTECELRDYNEMVEDGTTANGHDWGTETVIPPTCTEEGFTEKVCSVADCGAIEKTDIKPATGHYVEDWETTKATCLAEGQRTGTCENEGCGQKITEILPLAECSVEDYIEIIVPATQSTPCMKLIVCAMCEKEITRYEECELELMFDEDGAVVEITPRTCITNRVIAKQCVNCQRIAEVITHPAKGHTATVASGTPATCTEPGRLIYSTACADPECPTPDAIAGKEVIIPPRGHSETGTQTCEGHVGCENCDAIIRPALGHSYELESDSYNRTIPTFYCTRCGKEGSSSLATFNTITNSLKDIYSDFCLTKVTTFAMEKTQTSYKRFDFGIYTSLIRDMYEEEIANTPDTYKAVDKQTLRWILPITSDGTYSKVSLLENSDVDSVKVEKLTSLEFSKLLSGFNSEFTAKKYGKENIYNISDIKNVRVNENVIKVTLDIKNENYYLDIANKLSKEDRTAIQKIFDFDIRTQTTEFQEDKNGKLYMSDREADSGYEMTMTMTVNDILTDAKVTYYFLESTYEPIIAIYDIYQTMDQEIDMDFKIGITIKGEMSPVIKTQNTVVYVFENFTPST